MTDFPHDGYVTARQVAAYLDASLDYVYDHKHHLGAVRLPGTKNAVRYDAARVRRALAESRETAPHVKHARAPAKKKTYPFEVLRAA